MTVYRYASALQACAAKPACLLPSVLDSFLVSFFACLLLCLLAYFLSLLLTSLPACFLP